MGMPNLISRRLGAWPDGHPCQDQGRAPQTQRQELSSQDWNLQTGYPRLEPAISGCLMRICFSSTTQAYIYIYVSKSYTWMSSLEIKMEYPAKKKKKTPQKKKKKKKKKK